MKQIRRTLLVYFLALSFVILPAIGMAADFELFWDPNCNADVDLEGYYIYYKEGASVVDDPSGAIDHYVALSDPEFDLNNPSYMISGLLDDVRYCFAVTAWYGDEESDMSNEVCGVNGTDNPEPDPQPDPDPDDEQQIVIIDDGQPGASSIGGWYQSGGAHPYGTRSLYSRDPGAEYTFESPIAGRYEVALWWSQYASRCSVVPVEIYDGDVLIETVTVNQQQNSGQWNVLGTYYFSEQAGVVVVSEDSTCSTSADAVKFSVVEDLGSVIIDDGQPGSSSIGGWYQSGGAHPYGTRSLYSRQPGAEYTFESPIAGRYEVALWWSQYASRCSAVPVEIYDGDVLIETVTVNQQQNSGQWNVLGMYDFGKSASVKIISKSDNCSTCADAVQYQR